VVIDKAVSGDAVAARFVVALISPRPRGRTIHLDLPEECYDVVAAFDATLRGLADGEITPDEAVAVSRFLGARGQVLQAGTRAATPMAEERGMPGDAAQAAAKPGTADAAPDVAATAVPEPAAAAQRGVATEADPAPALQPACISAGLPPVPMASPLQSACISRSPTGGRVPVPAAGSDATLAARMLRRLAAGASVAVLAGAAGCTATAALSR
jgi:hypothetical protein